jgi:hypothetical protein
VSAFSWVGAGLRQTEAFATSSREGCGRNFAARHRRDPTTEISPGCGSGSAVVPAMTMIAFPAAGLPLSAPQIFRILDWLMPSIRDSGLAGSSA